MFDLRMALVTAPKDNISQQFDLNGHTPESF